MKPLGQNLVDQLLEIERNQKGPGQFESKKDLIAHFESDEPDLFAFFASKAVTPYQFLVRVQTAFENQSDVIFEGCVASKTDAVTMLSRYIPNLQYLHEKQLYTNFDSFKELGAAVAVGVVGTGLTEAVGRAFVSNPYLSMELAIAETSGIALLVFVYFLLHRNRSIFHKAPWNSAIYLGANLYETNPDNWEAMTWEQMRRLMRPSEGFTLFKSRPHYKALDRQYAGQA